MPELIDVESFRSGSIWYLKPLDKSDSLTVFAVDEQTGAKIVPLFSSREKAVAYLWRDSRHVEHVEPSCLMHDSHVVILLNWFQEKGFVDVALDAGSEPSGSLTIQEFRNRFES